MPTASADMAWYALPSAEVMARLNSSEVGLSSHEAAARLDRYGPNTIETAEAISPWVVWLHQLTSPLIYILLAAMVVTLAIEHWADSIVIGAVVILNGVIGFTQEYRAEKSMRALLSVISPKVVVSRDGQEREVDSLGLVPGDIILLESGSLVPADLRLLRSVHLQIDEALLTGESLPTYKFPQALTGDRLVVAADQRNMAFMGTTVVSGRGMGVVVATGSSTQVGSIAGEMRRTTKAETPLQSRMARFGKWISILIVGTSLAAFMLGLSIGESPVDMFLTAVAIAVSAIPEGLPVATTIALAVGVRRMARRNAIIRRLAAVETLGSCTVIVSDKTGTLTENRMTVQSIWAGQKRYGVTESGIDLEDHAGRDGYNVDVTDDGPLRLVLKAGVLANEATVQRRGDDLVGRGDPTEVALLLAGAKAGLWAADLLKQFMRTGEFPFEPEHQFSATVHRDGNQEVVFIKGAPERVVDMCRAWVTPEGVTEMDREKVLREARHMAGDGLRVLAMATGEGPVAAESTLAGRPQDLTFLGLQGMIDPPRLEVAEAVASCKRAGIRVVMVTGDHAGTAAAIAQRIGLSEGPPDVREGSALQAMSDEELDRTLRHVSVYARVSPVQKLSIVNALRKQGHIVAVTGDGVNDAPALKSAHIGAAMGRSGTDVAKNASDIVLVDDNFATVYAAVQEGRTSFSNIRKVTFFLVSSGVGELMSILASLALRMPLPFLPAQILWLNLVTNGVQDVALAFEPGEKEQYRRPPRDPKEGIMSRVLVNRTIFVGVTMAMGTLGMFAWELGKGAGLSYAQVTALTTMVMFQFFHVGNSRSEELSAFRKSPFSNRFLFLGAIAALAIHIGAMYFPPTQFLISLEPLTLETWGRLSAVSFSVIFVAEAHKFFCDPHSFLHLSRSRGRPERERRV